MPVAEPDFRGPKDIPMSPFWDSALETLRHPLVDACRRDAPTYQVRPNPAARAEPQP